MSKPKVSIITVTYNCINDIEATILSVLSQDYPNIEYIIVDGASKDGTVDVIRKYESQISKFVSEPDRGLYDAMNKGIRVATGQWCAFMNAGDAYTDSHTVSDMFAEIESDSNYKVVYGKTLYLEKDGTTHFHPTATIENLSVIFHKYAPYVHQSVFYNIDQKEDCYYDLQFPRGADYNTAIRYFKKYGVKRFKFMPVTVCTYKNFDGITSNPKTLKSRAYERYRIKKYNRMNPIEVIKAYIHYLLA